MVLDKADYKTKLDDILSNQNKFKLITHNPVATLKTEVNKLIAAANKNNKPKVLNPIVGEYSPGRSTNQTTR